MGWKYWRKVLGFFFISAASGAGLVAIGVYGEGFAKDDDKRLMYLVGGVLALTAVLGTFIENHMAERARARARERAIKAEAEMTLLYNNILLPSAQRMRDQVSKYVSDHPGPHLSMSRPNRTSNGSSKRSSKARCVSSPRQLLPISIPGREHRSTHGPQPTIMSWSSSVQ